MSGPTRVEGTPAAPLRAFVEELVAAGVRDVVVCPGSRSTPMALALAAHPGLRLLVDLDERGGGFLALGLAKASQRATAVLVTSGSAAANLLPAVVEADASRVPLVLLTADRPVELRDRGAPQTIDQVRMFGRFVRWDAELPVPTDDPLQVAHVRHVVARAVASATDRPPGRCTSTCHFASRSSRTRRSRRAPRPDQVRRHPSRESRARARSRAPRQRPSRGGWRRRVAPSSGAVPWTTRGSVRPSHASRRSWMPRCSLTVLPTCASARTTGVE